MRVHVIANTPRPRQNAHYFADGTFERIFSNETCLIFTPFFTEIHSFGSNYMNPGYFTLAANDPKP